MKRLIQFAAVFAILAGACAVLAIGAGAWMVCTEAAGALRVWGQAPAQIVSAINALPVTILPPVLNTVNAIGGDIATKADQRTGELIATGKQTLQVADAQLTATLSRVDTALGTVEAMRRDLKPAIDGATALEAQSTALVKDAQDSLDDSYWDAKALLESATDATTSVAQASEAVRDAAPKLTQSAVKIGDGAAGVARAAKREADELTKPQTFRQKLFAWLGIIPRIVKVIL